MNAQQFPNLDQLRLSQDFHNQVGVKKVIITVPATSPPF